MRWASDYPGDDDEWYAGGGAAGEEATHDLDQEQADRADERADVPMVPRTFSAHCASCNRPFAVFTSQTAKPVGQCPFCASLRVRYELVVVGRPSRPSSPAEVAHPNPVAPGSSGRRARLHRRAIQRRSTDDD